MNDDENDHNVEVVDHNGKMIERKMIVP